MKLLKLLSNLSLFIALFISGVKICSAQKITNHLVLKNKADDINVDRYGYIYEVVYDNLFKKNINGELQYSYSNKQLGKIGQLDVSNPLRPLILYKDLGVISILDNTLSLQENNIDLNNLSLYQTTCIANSNFDNGIWLFDVDVNEILKIDIHSSIIYRSGNLSAILANYDGPIIKMREFNKHLFAVTKTHVYEFDQFGSLISTINVDATKGFIIGNDNYLFYDGIYFKRYQKLEFKMDTICQNKSYQKVTGEIQHIIGISSNSTTIEMIEFSP